jgi:hypothetical protein
LGRRRTEVDADDSAQHGGLAHDHVVRPPHGTTRSVLVTPENTAPEAVDVGSSSRQVIEAIQNLGNGQRDFVEHMTRWAELQRDLAIK